VSLDHCPTLHEHCRRLWDDKHSEAQLGECLVQCSKSSSLASTRPTSETDSNNRMFARSQGFRMVKRGIFHAHIVLRSLTDVARLPPVGFRRSLCLLKLRVLRRAELLVQHLAQLLLVEILVEALTLAVLRAGQLALLGHLPKFTRLLRGVCRLLLFSLTTLARVLLLATTLFLGLFPFIAAGSGEFFFSCNLFPEFLVFFVLSLLDPVDYLEAHDH